MKLVHLLPAAALAFVACGGGEPAEQGSPPASSQPAARPAAPPAATGAMTVPSWMSVDNTARTVRMTITAGSTPEANYWNFNGTINGRMTITVPEGYRISIEFVNRDPNMAHSIGVSTETANFMTPPTPNPVFPGAMSQNPGSMTDGTMPGETEMIEFVAERAGRYSFVCYIPGHTAIGMWLYFNVSSTGEAGVQTS